MITKEEVNKLRFSKETSRIERTISKGDMDKFQEAICAFSNDMANSRKPGYLLIGVHDDGRLSGLKVDDKFFIPIVNDYRNPMIASAFKTLGYVNMFNRGVKEVQTQLKENGNPPAVFNVENLTVFEVTVLRNTYTPTDNTNGTSQGTSRGTSQDADFSIGQDISMISLQGVPSQSVSSQSVSSQSVPSRDIGMEIVLNGILNYCSEPKTLKEISEYLGIKAFKRVKTRYINRLLSENKMAMTIPDKPTSRFQKYVATKRSDMD